MQTITFHQSAPDPVQYAALFETTGWNDNYRATPEDLATAISRSWFSISAYDNAALVGFGRVVSDGVLYGMIYDMVVSPSFQGRGIGTAILTKLVERCRDAA